MKNNENIVLLHLKLINEWYQDEDKKILEKHGDVDEDGSITRTILIPSNMPLHNLHYAIQRLFGWQNSHLHSYKIDTKDFDRLTHGKVKEWSKLVGILFQGVSSDQVDRYWDDDYDRGNFKTWMKKKYTGPYHYGGYIEEYNEARASVKDMVEAIPFVDVKESFYDYYERTKDQDPEKKDPIKVLKQGKVLDLTIEELLSAVGFDTAFGELLERIEVSQILGCKGDPLAQYGELINGINGHITGLVTDKLIYNYDYGDNWTVEITRSHNLEELVANQDCDISWLHEAYNTVLDKYQPVCVGRRGKSVMDDVGGMGGYTNFLEILYNSDIPDEKEAHKAWAKDMGWTSRRMAIRKYL